MDIYKNFLPFQVTTKPTVFTLGSFDGIHLGHQYLFTEVIKCARARNAHSALVTFENHPSEILSPDTVSTPLISFQQKMKLIEEFGFDIVICLTFTKEIAELSADQFLSNIMTMLPLKLWIAGEDVAFGKGRVGNKDYLLKKGKQEGFEVRFLPKFYFENELVSSTLIRSLIAQGNYAQASKLLGRSNQLFYS